MVASRNNSNNNETNSPKEALVTGQLRKTTICNYFKAGRCVKGKRCHFAHGVEELQHQPDLSKTSICLNWTRARCRRSSSQCPFAHGDQELRTTGPFRAPGPSADAPSHPTQMQDNRYDMPLQMREDIRYTNQELRTTGPFRAPGPSAEAPSHPTQLKDIRYDMPFQMREDIRYTNQELRTTGPFRAPGPSADAPYPPTQLKDIRYDMPLQMREDIRYDMPLQMREDIRYTNQALCPPPPGLELTVIAPPQAAFEVPDFEVSMSMGWPGSFPPGSEMHTKNIVADAKVAASSSTSGYETIGKPHVGGPPELLHDTKGELMKMLAAMTSVPTIERL